MKTTQKDRILDYIRKFGSITSWEAYQDLGVMQLGARIDQLQKDGYQFKTEWEQKKNRYGEDVSFKRYYLADDIVQENMNHIPQIQEVAMNKVEIPLKLPSANEYINECRYNRFASAKYKADIQRKITPYIVNIPKQEKPVKIHFHWIEGNKKRDLDNICFSKKFILDTLVSQGKLKDDNRKCVCAFEDTFEYGNEFKVVLEIEEVDELG